MKNLLTFILIIFFFSCVTEPEEVYGCTISTACNFDSEANIFDDSCEYAEEFYNCAGECINDLDIDGVCDELDINYFVEDFDGNIYETVIIGEQEWMAENLKTTHYQNGDPIQYVQSESSEPDVWESLSTGAYGYYDDNLSNQETYGNLYNWYTVDDDREVCPVGWDVPTGDEWQMLVNQLGGGSIAGGPLKETGYEHWNSPNDGASNESGFTALPSGYRTSGNGNYYDIRGLGYFWSSSEYNSVSAWDRVLNYNYAIVYRVNNNKKSGFSVRCLSDVE